MEPTASQQLIDSLARTPSLFGPGVRQVELLQTHISWVLLAGDFAWKIKKPVDFGFLDFSTLERRKRFCEEELRLNGRLAPQLYLDVVAISGTPTEPRFDKSSPAIEYAVRMRRFEQSRLLSAQLAEGRLTPSQIDRLAERVADFHGSIAIAPAGAPFGTAQSVRAPVDENLRQLSRRPAELADRADGFLDTLSAWFPKEFEQRTPDFERRKRAGCIRECHGDMHLGNMILDDAGEVTIFDGIEFNDSLRWIDVASEIAFLTMDLSDRRRSDLSHRLLNVYLEQTRDDDLLRVLPYYQAYRATVRAKVALLRRKQRDLSDQERNRADDEVIDYLKWACEITRPQRPALFITHGFSGSGKTTGSQAALEAFGAVRVRSDVERKRLFGIAPLNSSGSAVGSGLYSNDANRRTRDRLRELAATILDAGRSAIVDATFLSRSSRALFRELARAKKAPFVILDFHAPSAVLRERVSRRRQAGGDASEATLEVLESQFAYDEPLDESERRQAAPIDATRALDSAALAREARRLIENSDV